ncbi:MAG: hypothetical protein KC422_04140 [Trueperaceae bacterium]|nr:hypothetical protein [Trueperaceae bacterium]
MNMKILPLLAGLILVIALSGCNLDNVFPTADINMSLEAGDTTTSQIEIVKHFADLEVDADTTVPCASFVSWSQTKLRVKAQARPGSIGANILGYSVDYYTADGNSIPTGTGESFRGSLSLRVPDGVVCSDKPSEEEPNGCTVNSDTAKFDYGQTVLSDAFIPIDSDVFARLDASATNEGSYASILFEGEDANGNYYSKLVSPITIVITASCDG